MWEIASALLLGALVGLQASHWWHLRGMDRALRELLKLAGQSARVTSAKPPAARDTVHLVLMDEHEKVVDYVLPVKPEQRAYQMEHKGQLYTCTSGSVEDGYFVYRA